VIPDPPAGSPSTTGDGGSLIFVSDASAEAERLTTALRSRGYPVVDVPLGLLMGRVAVQKPALILCDADAPGALDTVQRVREVPGGARIDVIFIGEPGQTVSELSDILQEEGSGIFVRPVDVFMLVRKVEALIGAPTASELLSRAPSAHRPPVLVAATRRPYRFEGGDSIRTTDPVPISSPSASFSAPLPPDSVRSGARSDSSPPNALGSVPPPSSRGSNSLASDQLMRAEMPSSIPAPSRQIPQARLSPDLEMLLMRAEQRVTQTRMSVPPVSERLSPEAELETILPADVLEALDEPLDIDDEDDDSNAGTHGGAEASGTKTGPGTGAGGTAATQVPGDAALSAQPEVPGTAPGENPRDVSADSQRSARSDAPATPPALRRPAPAETFVPYEVTSDGRPATVVPPTQYGPPPTYASHSLEPPTEPPPPLRDGGTSRHLTTRPPRPASIPADVAAMVAAETQNPEELDIPKTLGAGDSVRCVARLVRARYTGALAIEDEQGIRRIVFRDGDFVTAASSAEGESLLSFLIQRGNVPADTAARMGRRLPQFGRYAGAALIAQGHLRQDDLWPVLRSHAEWLIGRIAAITRGATSLELEIPARLQSEPAVFGGATGAEVLVEVVRRVVTPEQAIERLFGLKAQVQLSDNPSLLGECALSDTEVDIIRRALGGSLEDLLQQNPAPDFAAVLYALVELGVMQSTRDVAVPERAAPAHARGAYDQIDEDALRARIAARMALVEEGDYFALLGVRRSATAYDIRRAYTSLRDELDPGKILTGKTIDLRDTLDTILQVLAEAYEILGDDLRRERYRRALEAAP
jgi:hypothetical protein